MATHPIEHTEPKSVRELHLEHKQEYSDMADRQAREMGNAVKREFPIGCPVLFEHGKNKVKAVVVEHAEYSWNQDKVTVKNVNSGSKREIEAWRLERAEQTATA